MPKDTYFRITGRTSQNILILCGLTLFWEIGVGESRETAYNRAVILPYGAGNGRKNARNFYLFIIISPGLPNRGGSRWHYAIFEAYAERARKRWKVTTVVMVCWMAAVSFYFLRWNKLP